MITRVTDATGGTPLAAANVSASNVGNALVAWLGGLLISSGLGYTAPLYAGAAVVSLGLAVMVVTARTGCAAGPGPAGSHQEADGAGREAGGVPREAERRPGGRR